MWENVIKAHVDSLDLVGYSCLPEVISHVQEPLVVVFYFLSTHQAQATNIHMAMAAHATISPEGGGGPTRFMI
jgi:hypothetical protein